MSARFQDHFSEHAASYARARPRYPAALFDFLAGCCARRERAWDCGAGSGQASVGLAGVFTRVLAGDASLAQLARLERDPRILPFVTTAERAPLRAASLDLVAVAQALHWFDLERFYAEVRRVLRPAGVLAAWCYGLVEPEGELGPAFHRFHDEVRSFWPPERVHVESGYATLPFPFAPVPAPPRLEMDATWDLERFLGYLDTWSCVARYRRARGTDPVRAHAPELARAWGDPRHARRLRWPLRLLVGRLAGGGGVGRATPGSAP